MRTYIPLIALALAACSDSPQDEREDAMEEVADAVEEARQAGVELQVVDAATIENLVPPNCTVVGEPMRGKLGEDEMEATYFVTQREDGRVQAHRTRDVLGARAAPALLPAPLSVPRWGFLIRCSRPPCP